MKPSKVICPNCFSTDVRCEVWVNPNTNELDPVPDANFRRGQCFACHKQDEPHGFLILIHVSSNIEKIDKLYAEYIEEHYEEPLYVHCLVVYTDNRNYEGNVQIKLSSGFDEKKDQGVDHFCGSLNDLKSLCDKGMENFVIRKIYCFE